MTAPANLEAHLQTGLDSDTSPQWRDLTPYLLLTDDFPITIARGRQEELEDVEAGTCTFTVDNSDGSFTPDQSASGWYPNITTDKRVRLRFAETTGNLITSADDRSMETTVGTWAAFFGNSTVTRDNTRAWDGSWSCKVAYLSDTNPFASAVIAGDWVMGKTYTASVYVYVPSGQPAATLNSLDFSGSASSTTTNAWERLSLTFTIPDTWSRTDGLNFCVGWSGASAAQSIWFDGFMVNEGSTAATYTATAPTYNERFTGTTTSWIEQWPGGGNFCVTQVSVSDPCAYLARYPLRSVGVEQLLLHPNLYALYPLDDASTQTYAYDASGLDNPKATIETVGSAADDAFSFGSGPTGTSGGANFAATGPISNTVFKELAVKWTTDPRGQLGWAEDRTIICAFRIPTTATATYYGGLCGVVSNNGVTQAIRHDDSGNLQMYHVYGNGVGITININTKSSGVDYRDGEWHVAMFSIDYGAQQAKLWADGAVVATNNFSSFLFGASNHHLYIGGYGPKGIGLQGDVACVALLNAVVTTTEAQDISDALLNGFSGLDRSDERIARYLAYAGVSNYSLDTGYETKVAHIDTDGSTAWDAIETVTETEGGITYALRGSGGTIRFQNRRGRWNKTPSLSVDQQGVSKDSTLSVDNIGYCNHATATSEEAGKWVARNDSDITLRGIYPREFPVATTSTASLRNRAGWAVRRFSGDPKIRAKKVGVDLTSADSTVVADAQALDLWDWLEVTTFDSTTGPDTTITEVIEGYVETISLNNWRMDFNTSPGKANRVLKLDDTTLGTVDSADNILAF